MKTATLLLTFIGFTTSYGWSQAAAGYGGAAATSTTTAAGAAGGLGRAEGGALSRIGSTTAGKTGGSGSTTTVQVSRTDASTMRARRISAELTKDLDSKDAKVGDEVTARTTSAVMLANGVRLPVGARLIGEVTEVQMGSGGAPDGHLAFAFRRIVLSDGRQVGIHATLDSISAPLVASSGRTAPVSSAPPPVVSAPIRVTGSDGSTLYGAGVVAHGSGGNAPALSSLPGITAGSSETSSTILDAKGSNIVLSHGTQMVFRVATH